MLDILMPVSIQNVTLAPESIAAIHRCTDVPFRLIIIVDGGHRSDFVEIEKLMAEKSVYGWTLMHNEQPVYLNQSLREGLEECREKLTAIIPPQAVIDDMKWFGKIQQVFHRDPVCGIVDTEPNTKSATFYPVKRVPQRPTPEGCRFAVVQTSFAKKTPPFGDIDPVTFWSKQVMSNGGSSWAAPGVRYSIVQHEEHPTWRASLVTPTPSESRSPTTPDSSSATTTGRGGSKGSRQSAAKSASSTSARFDD